MKTIENTLYFDDCNTVELAQKYGTPLLLISEEKLKDKAREIRDDFLNLYDNVRAVYASKAFLNTSMCKIVQREGLGLDVVSGGELYIAKSAGFPMEKIVFHGNNKSKSELTSAVLLGVGRIVVDNLSELNLLNHICEDLQNHTQILFRITPEVSAITHAYIATANRDSKFGLTLESVQDAYQIASASKWISSMGLHFHVGSQLQETTAHFNAFLTALELIDNLAASGFTVHELNTGGGFGVQYTEDDKEMSLKSFVEPMMTHLQNWSNATGIKRPQIIIEPGRWFVASAGLTLYEIGSVKTIPNVRTYISVDGGIPDNIRPALYTAQYRAVIANKMDKTPSETVTIAGKCCESGDILIKDICLPKSERGDLLAVFATGAYTESMSSNYNYLTRPAVALLHQGKASLIRKRETFEDMISRDLLPEHLL